MPPLISIVSGTYNRLPYLRDMVQSVRDNIPAGVHYEIVLVDGGSTDGTLEWCKAQHDIRLIEHGALLGAIRAFTEGAYAAAGKYVLLANDDIEFTPNAIMRALVYLEENPRCGAVAFPDNRWSESKTAPPHEFGCQYMPATKDGAYYPVIYAQVGLFRKHLGDRLNWWGYGEIDAQVYGGDNFLSSRLWENGYTVDCVQECRVIDHIPADELRALNETYADKGYVKLYPRGANVVDIPRIQPHDDRDLRVLYLPIFEKGHAQQKRQKRGLRDALARRYIVWELDYQNTDNLERVLTEILQVFKPHLILTQFHGADNKPLLELMRLYCGNALVINWNGDVWPHGLTTREMLDMLKLVDLQLVVNESVLPTYQQHGIRAAYWQIGFEDPKNEDLPETQSHDIVFLANCYSDERRRLGEFLKALPYDVGIYGSGWGDLSSGECLYDFKTSRALYKRAKIAIGDNQFPEQRGFVSNRIFEALSAGGALLLHQTVAGLEELTGLRTLIHYDWWDTFDTLRERIEYYLNNGEVGEDIRTKMVNFAHDFVRSNHSFDARVNELVALIEGRNTKREIGGYVTITNPRIPRECGLLGVTGQSYQYQPGQSITVDYRDAEFFLARGEGWQRV